MMTEKTEDTPKIGREVDKLIATDPVMFRHDRVPAAIRYVFAKHEKTLKALADR